jgi:predicted ribosome quality control (RQC) complex YloA/Tae2 family protein
MKEQIISDNDIEFKVLIGRNAQDNWDIISISNHDDLWFHIESNPSCHVILKTEERDIPKKVIYLCAQMCKENSKFKGCRSVAVIYSKIRDIRKGGKVGEVIVRNSKTHRILV